MIHNHYDVVILGGGLAGGCLGRQLHMEAPALRTLLGQKAREAAAANAPAKDKQGARA